MARLRPRPDGGFTLIELMVALSLLALVAASLVPLLIVGVRATTVAKMNTQARNLTQARLEQMRNLPFHVDAQNGSFVDLLDRYYRDLARPGVVVANDICSSRTYVAAGDPVTAGEPTRPFYRCTIDALPGFPLFKQVIASQFLGASPGNTGGVGQAPPAVVTPRSTYNSQTVGADASESNLLGVTILTTWKTGTISRTEKVYSQIANPTVAAQTIDAQARVSALRLTGTAVFDGVPRLVTLEAGAVNIDGSRYSGSTASANATGAFAESETLGRVVGAQRTVTAPPDVASGNAVGTSAGLSNSCTYACLANSSVSNVGASVANGLPTVGASATNSQVRAELQGSGGQTAYGFEYANGMDSARRTYLLVGTGSPLVRTVATNNSTASATGRAWLAATSAGSQGVTAAASATTSTLAVFPTSFAPDGLLQVALTNAAVSCAVTVSGSTGTATPTTAASSVVQYLPRGGSAYVDVPAGANLTTLLVGPTGSTLTLADYIGVITRNAATSSSESNGRVAKAKNIAALQIRTNGVRELSAGVPDPESGISMDLGVMSCVAEDQR